MRIKIYFIFLLFITSFLIELKAQQTGEFTSAVTWSNMAGTQSRSLAMYVPTNYNANEPYTLFIAFHGLGDTPSNYLNSTNSVKNYALDSYFGNVIVACPDEGTTNTSWIVGEEDFGIIGAIKSHVGATYNIDPNQVYAQGFSYGGRSAFLHGLEEADEIQGVIAFSPAFYGDEDLDNNCVSPNCNHHDYNYANADKIKICTSAGQLYNGFGEGYMTPLDQSDQSGATWKDSFLGLAMYSAEVINNNGGDALFIESTNQTHAIPPMTISKQCWDHVKYVESVTPPEPSSVSKSISDQEIKVFPQPATGYVNVIGNDLISWRIIDLLGKEVLKGYNTQGGYIQIETLGMKSGMYILYVQNSKSQVYSRKIVLD